MEIKDKNEKVGTCNCNGERWWEAVA